MSTTHRASPEAPTTWPPEIRARYGITGRRWQPAVFIVLGLAFAAVVAGLGWRAANPDVKGVISAYATISDTRMDMTLDVMRRTDEPVTCVLRARASDSSDVGYALVEVPAGRGQAQVRYRMATAYRALVGELLGCAPGGIPAGVAGAQFRPGVLPPTQPWQK
jgi:hypothetical protein